MTGLVLSRSRSFFFCLVTLLLACDAPKAPLMPRRAMSIAIVADVSTSAGLKPGQTIADLRCSEVVAVTAEALTMKGLSRLDVLVLATGGKETSLEARCLIPWRSFVPQARLFGKNRHPHEQRQAFLQGLETSCRGTLKGETTSPIFFATERATESLRQHAKEGRLSGEVVKRLVVLSDLRENAHQSLKARLLTVSNALRKGVPTPKQGTGVPSLNLDGISLSVCGLAEHAGGNADDLAITPRAVTEVWQGVFQGAASFDAACPERPAFLSGGPR
ncbi:MAG: hypothetical protein JNJ46_30475 [Myxococcales bacterium]|nr:hypothetical protein [Myxococcales bacterium]